MSRWPGGCRGFAESYTHYNTHTNTRTCTESRAAARARCMSIRTAEDVQGHMDVHAAHV